MPERRRFRVVLIKPSHYDDDGYVIQWLRSGIPSNSLACVYALLHDCSERRILGEDVDIEIEPLDETNTVIPLRRIIRDLKAADGGFVGLVGVQSNQFPRAVDMARVLRAAGVPVVIGGFHVSGCLAMLPELPSDIREAQELGVTLFAGEAEGRMETLVKDIWAGDAKPLYNFMNDLPELSRAITPFLPSSTVKRTIGSYSSFDAGRGCPFQCSFCTIINVQGRKSRYRTPDDVEQIIRANAKQGVRRFFISDDNFARNKNWESILDRLIELRAAGFKFKFTIQVDTLCHRMPGFIEKAARAGCNRVFIGLENIDPDALMGAKKRQNKIWEYRKMLQAWKEAGVITYAGYIVGFPNETPEKILNNIEIIKRELPLDLMEFFALTPLPGSEDHKKMVEAGQWMDPDMNKYELHHPGIAEHPRMSSQEWNDVYYKCWSTFFTEEHLETVLRRGAARRVNTRTLFTAFTGFLGAIQLENVHPLEGGMFRRKVRTQRRHGLPLVNPLIFYPRRAVEIGVMLYRAGSLFLRYRRIWNRVRKDPNRHAYTDLALQPVTEDETTDLMTTYEAAIPHTHGAPVKAKDRRILVPAEAAE